MSGSSVFATMADSLLMCGVTECLLSTQILVERGLSFPDAISLLNAEVFPGEGFYISKKVHTHVTNVCHGAFSSTPDLHVDLPQCGCIAYTKLYYIVTCTYKYLNSRHSHCVYNCNIFC